MIYSLISILCDISYAFHLPKYLGVSGKNKIIVLMYHGIIKSYSQNPLKNIFGYHISEEEFEDQMEYLSKYCNVIKASEATAGEKISRDKKNVVITFDDGYRNNYTNAFPILSKYKLPALFAISTEFIINKVPLWPDIIEYAVINTSKKSVHIKWNNLYHDFRLDTTDEKIKFMKWLLTKCTEIDQEKRNQFISYILKESDISFDNNKILKDPDYEPLTPGEIKTMSESKIAEFASHSANHYVLSRTNENTLVNELKNSKSAIEQITGQPCKFFCIPGGFYNNSIIKTIIDTNFEKVFSSDYTEIDPADKQTILGRYCVTKNINMASFVDIIHGPFHRMYYSLKPAKRIENFKKSFLPCS